MRLIKMKPTVLRLVPLRLQIQVIIRQIFRLLTMKPTVLYRVPLRLQIQVIIKLTARLIPAAARMTGSRTYGPAMLSILRPVLRRI